MNAKYPYTRDQYYDRILQADHAKDKRILPYRLLWGAVLKEAYDNLAGKGAGLYSRKEKERERQDARRWFLSRRQDTGSFRWVCKALDIDPEDLLRVLRDRGLLNGNGGM